MRGEDAQIAAVVAVIAKVAPDILLLQRFEYDHDLIALSAFADTLREAGIDYPYTFALPPNSGVATGLDMDGNGRLGEARDAQGYGDFAGQGGMALLSRYPIDDAGVRDFTTLLWRDFPGALLPTKDGAPFPSPEAQEVQRLSSVGHWDVPVVLPGGTRLRLLSWHGTTPVFDGEEDCNGRRNHDETAFWGAYIDGTLAEPAPDASFIVLGDANLDPADGDGRGEAIRALLAHPLLHDPEPQSEGGVLAANQGGINARQRGDPAFDTADWPDTGGKPGNMRVDYVLPSRDLEVVASGVFWPASGPMAEVVATASRHRMVWVDIQLP